MKMMMIVLPCKKGDNFLAALINAGFTATYSETRGGMLRQSQLTLFVAVNEKKVKDIIGLIRETCSLNARVHYGFGITQPAPKDEEGDCSDIGVSGAVVFVWSLERFELP